MAQKKYKKQFAKGSSRAYTFGDDHVLFVSVNVNQLKEVADSGGWVQLEIRERKDGPNEYGNTHNCMIPNEAPTAEDEAERKSRATGGGTRKPKPKQQEVEFEDEDDDDLPF